jgi:hypothetical protein
MWERFKQPPAKKSKQLLLTRVVPYNGDNVCFFDPPRAPREKFLIAYYASADRTLTKETVQKKASEAWGVVKGTPMFDAFLAQNAARRMGILGNALLPTRVVSTPAVPMNLPVPPPVVIPPIPVEEKVPTVPGVSPNVMSLLAFLQFPAQTVIESEILRKPDVARNIEGQAIVVMKAWNKIVSWQVIYAERSMEPGRVAKQAPKIIENEVGLTNAKSKCVISMKHLCVCAQECKAPDARAACYLIFTEAVADVLVQLGHLLTCLKDLRKRWCTQVTDSTRTKSPAVETPSMWYCGQNRSWESTMDLLADVESRGCSARTPDI